MLERKYKIENNQLVKRSTGVPVPDDMPCFILLAQDRKALAVLTAYSMILDNLDQKEAVTKCINDFREFLEKHPDRVKEPTP